VGVAHENISQTSALRDQRTYPVCV